MLTKHDQMLYAALSTRPVTKNRQIRIKCVFWGATSACIESRRRLGKLCPLSGLREMGNPALSLFGGSCIVPYPASLLSETIGEESADRVAKAQAVGWASKSRARDSKRSFLRRSSSNSIGFGLMSVGGKKKNNNNNNQMTKMKKCEGTR